MVKLHLTIGKIVDTEDDKQLGRVKVKALHEHADTDEAMLPWAIPFMGGYVSEIKVKHDPCTIGDMVWLAFEDTGKWDPCYFIPFFSLPESFNYQALTDRMANVTNLEEFGYGTTFIELFDNGDIVFRNKANGDSVYLKNANTFIYMKGTGEIFTSTPEKAINVTNGKATVGIAEDGAITVSNDNITLSFGSDGAIDIQGASDVSVSGTNVTVEASTSLTLSSGDASAWAPNCIPKCLFTGTSHSGITKLNGG